MGVYDIEDTEEVDNGRIDKFIRKSIRDFRAINIRSKSLAFDSLAIVNPTTAPTTVAPTLQMHEFGKTCPNSAGFLPVWQDILDLQDQKVQAADQKAALHDIIQAHNKEHSPSGAPFKGEAKWPAPQTDDGNQAKGMPCETAWPTRLAWGK